MKLMMQKLFFIIKLKKVQKRRAVLLWLKHPTLLKFSMNLDVTLLLLCQYDIRHCFYQRKSTGVRISKYKSNSCT